jgi:DNA-damage-inducible protein J
MCPRQKEVEIAMPAEAVVRARIRSELKQEATAVLKEMGLSVSDAIRLMLTRVAAERALPFDIRVPNRETEAALAAIAAGEVTRFASVDALMADLDGDDGED